MKAQPNKLIKSRISLFKGIHLPGFYLGGLRGGRFTPKQPSFPPKKNWNIAAVYLFYSLIYNV